MRKSLPNNMFNKLCNRHKRAVMRGAMAQRISQDQETATTARARFMFFSSDDPFKTCPVECHINRVDFLWETLKVR